MLIPLSLIGFAYGIMHDFAWLKLLSGGYLISAILLGSPDENRGDSIILVFMIILLYIGLHIRGLYYKRELISFFMVSTRRVHSDSERSI